MTAKGLFVREAMVDFDRRSGESFGGQDALGVEVQDAR